MQHPDLDRVRRRAKLRLRGWTIVQFLFVSVACAAFAGVVVMVAVTLLGVASRDALHDDFVGTVIVLGLCMLAATITTVPIERLKRRVNALTDESEG